MKRPLSLKLSIAVAFLAMGLVIVLGYSMLSVQFFFRGMDSLLASNMETALASYVDTTSKQERKQGQEFSGYFISQDWAQQPVAIRQAFTMAPELSARLQKQAHKTWFTPPDLINFLIKLNIGDEVFFISRSISHDQVSPLIGRNAKQSRQLVLLLSIGISVLLALIVWVLIRHVSQPVSRLTHWTHELSPEQLKQDIPDFSYPELNEMAALIQRSLSTVHSALEREQQFLRFTSHELRTPISIIRNNVELSHKLGQQHGQSLPDKQMQIFDRIDRASLTMKHLTETLLWLSREQPQQLEKHSFNFDHLISQIVDEMRYLLRDKPVKIELHTSPTEITQSPAAVRIIIGNLIRNAFQHTWDGHITIQQQGNQVIIDNHCQLFNNDVKSQDQGFGLGLQLTEKLCKRLGWQYENQPQNDGHHVSLLISA